MSFDPAVRKIVDYALKGDCDHLFKISNTIDDRKAFNTAFIFMIDDAASNIADLDERALKLLFPYMAPIPDWDRDNIAEILSLDTLLDIVGHDLVDADDMARWSLLTNIKKPELFERIVKNNWISDDEAAELAAVCSDLDMLKFTFKRDISHPSKIKCMQYATFNRWTYGQDEIIDFLFDIIGVREPLDDILIHVVGSDDVKKLKILHGEDRFSLRALEIAFDEISLKSAYFIIETYRLGKYVVEDIVKRRLFEYKIDAAITSVQMGYFATDEILEMMKRMGQTEERLNTVKSILESEYLGG